MIVAGTSVRTGEGNYAIGEGRGQGREEGKAERREGIGRAEQGKGALWSSSSHGSRNFAEDRVSDMCELDVSLVSNVLTYLA